MAIKVNGQLCERESQTYSGLVCHILRCDRKCISWEKAVHGACHIRNWWRRCYCYFDTPDCSKLPTPPAAGGNNGTTGGGKGGDGGGKVGSGGGSTGDGGGSGGKVGSGGGSSGGGNNPCKQYVNRMLGMN